MSFRSQVLEFLDFTGGMCDERTAEDFIRGNDSFEKAVQAFFDDPSPQKYREQRNWTESSFSAGKDGVRSQMDELPPYQMEEDERESRSQLRPLGAPSRPPSREKSRISLRSGRDVNMQEYGPHRPPDDDDAEMREAIRLSMEDQETGVIGASGREYVPDVDPQDRMRKPGEPAFLKPLPSNVFLPALITILHSIPQCREIFLSRADLSMDYGENRHWWEGERIETTRIIDIESGTNVVDPLEVVHEVQRLMAFLDVTDRSYGSAGALAHLHATQRGTSATTGVEPIFVRFMRAWQAGAERARTNYEFEYPFRSTIQGSHPEGLRQLYCVDIGAADLPIQVSPGLYDILDNCFWPNASTSDENSSSLGHIAPIMVMRLASRNKPAVTPILSIPAVLYADRYMEQSKELVRQMRSDLADHDTVIEDLGDQIGNVDIFQYSMSNKVGNASKLLESAIGFVNLHNEVGTHTVGAPTTKQEPADEAMPAMGADQVLSRLQQIYEELRLQIESITEHQARVVASAARLKALLTDPDVEDGPIPVAEYQLRGVGIVTTNQSNTTYLMHPPTGSGGLDTTYSGSSWWRVTYDTAGDKAIVTKEQVSEKTVLDAAGELLSETLLVYASKEMLAKAEDQPLPQALQEFVALDNATLRSELEGSPPPTEINIIEGHAIEIEDNDILQIHSSTTIPRTILSPPTPPPQAGDSAPMLLNSSTMYDNEYYTAAPTPRMGQQAPKEMQEVRPGGGAAPFFGDGIAAGKKRVASRQGPFGLRGGALDIEDDGYEVQDSDTETLVGDGGRGDVDTEMRD